MYFFHYTSRNAHDTMTGDTPWRCEARQPQKNVWYADQHEKGFYVTPLSPAEMTEKASRKTGGGAKAGDYVLVFKIDIAVSKILKDAPVTVGSVRLKLVGHPAKFALTRSGSTTDETVPFTEEMCVWSGPVQECGFQYQNPPKVIEQIMRK